MVYTAAPDYIDLADHLEELISSEICAIQHMYEICIRSPIDAFVHVTYR